METKTNIESVKQVGGVQLLNLQIKRDAESELKITIQSNERYWQSLKRQDESTCVIGGIVCFRPKVDRLGGVPGFFTMEDNFIFEEFPNMTMLLASDLSRGVTFNFGKIPVSEKKLNEWKDEFEKQVRIIYLTYIKPVNIRASFTTSTVSSTFHE